MTSAPRSRVPPPPPERACPADSGGEAPRWAWAPLPLFGAAIALLALARPPVAWNPPALFTALNTLFLTLTSLLVAWLAARSYLAEAYGPFLLLGCGALALGLGGVLAAAALFGAGANAVATIYNTSAGLAGLCHLASAILDLRRRRARSRPGWPALLVAYLAVAASVLALASLARAGALPPFLVEGRGATLQGRIALYVAAAAFALSALVLIIGRGRELSAFRYWYGLGLALLALGLLGVSLQGRLGDPLNWAGRLTQYTGGVYMLAAGLSAARTTDAWLLPLERTLRQAEERYRLLFETMSEGFALHELLYDPAGRPVDYRFLQVNPAFEQQTGLRAADVVGRTVREVLPQTESFWLERYAEVARTGIPAQLESFSAPLGRWYEVRAFRPEPGRFAAVFLDITARKQAEEALRGSEQRLQDVLQNTRDVLYRVNLQTGQYEYLSPSVVALGGYTAEEVQAMGREAMLERIPVEDREGYLALLAAAREGGTEQDGGAAEYRWRRRDGAYLWVSNRWKVVRDARGLPAALVGTLSDVTERKTLERRLVEANADLEARIAERTAQLRALASDLVQAEEQERRRMAQMLHDGPQQSIVAAKLQAQAALRAAQDPSESLAQIAALLDEALAASRTLVAELSPHVLYDEGLVSALDWLAEWMQARYGLRVAVQAQADPGPQLSEELAVSLFRSVRELLINVVKHAGTAEAVVELSRPTPETLAITVSDRGRGFELTPLPGQATSGSFGLFSIQERLAYLGGSLRLESAPGQGARATLEAPLRGAAARQTTVVLADDHAMVRSGLAQMLNGEEDIRVVGEAEDGAAALELVRRLRPDVVLMDIAMPVMDGIEATRRILAEFPHVRVIGLSMSEGVGDAEMRQAGAAAYLSKTARAAQLLAAIRATA